MKKYILRIFTYVILIICFTSLSAYAYSAYGSKGKEVSRIQLKLCELGYYTLECDGVFGKGTERAVMDFQKNNNLDCDGIAGSKTLLALDILSENDINLLSAVINGEARGESYKGQVAVGAVVLNRVKHPAFPDSLKGVVYQKGAFSAVNDGQIKLKVTNSCRRAAIAALKGEDPTNGAIYYYNPKTATCKWIRTRTAVKQIGNHLFCK